MPATIWRVDLGGYLYHVFNRDNDRLRQRLEFAASGNLVPAAARTIRGRATRCTAWAGHCHGFWAPPERGVMPDNDLTGSLINFLTSRPPFAAAAR
jgi:hypothetical protein